MNQLEPRSRAAQPQRSWWFLLLLGTPTFGLSFSASAIAIYLPVIIGHLANPIKLGLIVGLEGVFGLFVPLFIGIWTDSAKTVSKRLMFLYPSIFMLIGASLFAGFAHSLVFLAAVVALYYAGYYAFLPPYLALYVDLVPTSQSGRSRSAESIWLSLGSAAALIGGGFLFDAWRPFPFLLSALFILLGTSSLVWSVRQHDHQVNSNTNEQHKLLHLLEIFKADHNIRYLLLANAAFTATITAVRVFVVLFFTVGHHQSMAYVSGLIFPIAAVCYGISSVFCGKLADKFGHTIILKWAALAMGLGMILPFFGLGLWTIIFFPVVAAGAGIVSTLPYALMIRMSSHWHSGALASLFSVSQGMGALLGPITAGITIFIDGHWQTSTHGYNALWLILSIFTLIGWVLIRQIKSPI